MIKIPMDVVNKDNRYFQVTRDKIKDQESGCGEEIDCIDDEEVNFNSGPYNVQIVPSKPKPVDPDVDKDDLACQVINAHFKYDKKGNQILAGVNINVRKGEIYALLGPSGCGKTTILKCITNTIKLQEGEVWMPKKQRKSGAGAGVGFMPQELSLFPQLSIQETLWLFGRLYRITASNLKDRIDKYSKLFELPPKHRQIGAMSGGQKRRVSFVSALLRDAPLLILDEPTVGLDPILRQTIWNYLVELTSQNNRTVLLTTHYIDEAKDANNIGLMRDGKILVEASPTLLMSHYGDSSLEACFYKLCVTTESEAIATTSGSNSQEPESEKLLNQKTVQKKKNNIKKPLVSFKKKVVDELVSIVRDCRPYKYSPSNIGYLTKKNLQLLKRNTLMMFFQFILPAVTVALFGICIGEDISGIKLAVVNDEDPVYLSENLLNEMDDFPLIKQPYRHLEDGLDCVRRGECLAAVYFQGDFSYCFLHRLNLGILVNNATIECSNVKLYLDTTNQILSLSMFNYIFKSFQHFHREILITLDATPSIARLPVEFQKPIFGKLKVKYSEYILPTVLLICIHYLSAALAGITLIMEQENGVFERLQISGVSKPQIFAAQLITNSMVVLVQVFLMLLVQLTLFFTDPKGSVFLIAVLVTLQGICGCFFGLLISALTNSVNTGVMIGLGVMYPNLVTCGFLWPLEGIPLLFRKLAYFVPVTLNNIALRSLFSRGWGLENAYVWYGFISVLVWTAVFLLFASILFRYRK